MSSDTDVPDTDGWAEKLADFDFGNFPDDAEPATTENPVVGSPLPSHVDAEVAVEAAEEGSLWFGMKFGEIPAELKQEAWTELRRWVDQFVIQQNFIDVVSPCWFQHPDAVNELYATFCADYKVWEEGAPSVGPFLSFQSYLPGLKQRLRDSTLKGCLSAKRHTWVEPQALQYDQEAWEKTRDTVVDVVSVYRTDNKQEVRAAVKHAQGTVPSSSRQIGPTHQTVKVLPEIRVRDRAAVDEVLLEVVRHREDDVSWQIEREGKWHELEIPGEEVVDMSGD